MNSSQLSCDARGGEHPTMGLQEKDETWPKQDLGNGIKRENNQTGA